MNAEIHVMNAGEFAKEERFGAVQMTEKS